LSTTQDFSKTRMPEPQQRRQSALLQGSDNGHRPRQLPCPAVHERDPGIGGFLELLQDETQRLLEQLRHEFRLEGRPEHSAGTQHAQHVRWEHGPIIRSCRLISRRLVRNLNHRSLTPFTVYQVNELCDPPLWYATHGEEQWQTQPARTLEDLSQGVHASLVSSIDGYEGEDHVPCSAGGEPVARFDEQGVQRGCGHFPQKPLPQS
jgi:hypothetical protein